jgi:hypothetical protein
MMMMMIINLHYSVCKGLGIKKDTLKVRTHTRTHASIHAQKVYEHEAVTVLWNQGVHINRELTANRRSIITKNKKGEHAC